MACQGKRRELELDRELDLDLVMELELERERRREEILWKWKRPWKNTTNKNHLQQIFGDEHVAEIESPGVVNDYNFKMKGVDL